jgi:amino acid transporter
VTTLKPGPELRRAVGKWELLALGGTFIGMIRISVIARILPYLLTCAAVPVLRRKYPAERGYLRLPGGWVLPAAGIVLCLWLFTQCSRQDLAAAAVALLAGFGLYALSAILRRHESCG